MKHQAVVKMSQTKMGKMILLALFSWTSAVANSSVAKGGYSPPPHRPEEYVKYLVFSTFEADFCTKNENSPPLALAMRIGQGPDVI